jgi:hypothetical protein
MRMQRFGCGMTVQGSEKASDDISYGGLAWSAGRFTEGRAEAYLSL